MAQPNGITELMRGASRGDVSAVRRCLTAGGCAAPDVNAQDIFGNTALIYAAGAGHAEVVDLLLSGGADARSVNQIGMSARALAGARGHTAVSQRLAAGEGEGLAAPPAAAEAVQPPAPPTIQSILLRAIWAGDPTALQECVRAGADVNAATSDGWTPLMVAAIKGGAEIVTELLALGADVQTRNEQGWTALRFAASMDEAQVLRLLLAHGADPNAQDASGWTALMQVVHEQSLESMDVLLAHGADVTIRNAEGDTVWAIAQRGGARELMARLGPQG